MSKPPINQDGISYVEIKAAFKVLEEICSTFNNDEMGSEEEAVNTTRYLVQQYENESEWRQPNPSDNIDPSGHQTLDSFEAKQ